MFDSIRELHPIDPDVWAVRLGHLSEVMNEASGQARPGQAIHNSKSAWTRQRPGRRVCPPPATSLLFLSVPWRFHKHLTHLTHAYGSPWNRGQATVLTLHRGQLDRPRAACVAESSRHAAVELWNSGTGAVDPFSPAHSFVIGVLCAPLLATVEDRVQSLTQANRPIVPPVALQYIGPSLPRTSLEETMNRLLENMPNLAPDG